MRRAILSSLVLCLALFLFGCGQASNSVGPLKLTDREELLISALSERSFVFEYDLDTGKYSWIMVWVEEYQNGEKTESEDMNMSCGAESKGMLILTIPRSDGEVTMNAAVSQASALYTRSDLIPDMAESVKKSSCSWGEFPATMIPESGKAPLAILRYNGADGFTVLSDAFYRDYENNIDEISDDDTVYIIGCTFTDIAPDEERS
jgi:hypothetical protein